MAEQLIIDSTKEFRAYYDRLKQLEAEAKGEGNNEVEAMEQSDYESDEENVKLHIMEIKEENRKRKDVLLINVNKIRLREKIDKFAENFRKQLEIKSIVPSLLDVKLSPKVIDEIILYCECYNIDWTAYSKPQEQANPNYFKICCDCGVMGHASADEKCCKPPPHRFNHQE